MTFALALACHSPFSSSIKAGSRSALSTASAPWRTLPSLAILAVMMPVLGIGLWPSIVALTVLALPPILLNAMSVCATSIRTP